MPIARIETDRLVLRRWRQADLARFAAINADPRVMAHFPVPLSREQSDALVRRIEEGFETHGFGAWALEMRATGEFIGFAGLSVPRFEADFTPCVEAAWRLAAEHWGHGYATEAAHAAIRDGFDRCGLEEIVSFTVVANLRSRRVMERLGMTFAGEFEHPDLPEGHPLRRHLLYRLRRTA